jgi:small conductance mechanosensitive channel
MNNAVQTWASIRELVWQDILTIIAIIIASRILVVAVRWSIRQLAENGPARMRLKILRFSPRARVVIDIAAIAAILPIIVEPTFHNTLALLATVGIAIAFALKDYVSGLVAGIVTVFEGTYQPGDWIEVDGAYGEVKSVGVRAVHLITADDTEVIIPHSRLWSSSVFNATSGNRSLLCVANFYLDADHDSAVVLQRLTELGEDSPYRKADSRVVVRVSEKPWGTLYKVKAYVAESRDQFAFVSDVTVRAKTALREMSVRFAQVPYSVGGGDVL